MSVHYQIMVIYFIIVAGLGWVGLVKLRRARRHGECCRCCQRADPEQ